MKLWKIYTPVAITKVKTVHANNASESENGAGLSPGSAPLVALSMLIVHWFTKTDTLRSQVHQRVTKN